MGRNIVAVDVGFSWLKGTTRTLTGIKNQAEEYKTISLLQPSVVGEPVDVYAENLKPDDIIYREKEKGQEYFVGNLAVRHSQVKYVTKKNDKTDTWTTKILLKTALSKLLPGQQVKLVSSLPYEFYFKQQTDFKTMLEELNKDGEYEIEDGKKRESIKNKVEIVKSKIAPQGYAAAMSYILDDTGKVVEEKRADAAKENVVIDIGFNNLGLIVMDAMEISTRSKSPEDMGITKCYEVIQQYLKKQLGHAPTLYDLDKYVLKGMYDNIDISGLVEQAMKIYANLVQMEIDNYNTRFNKYFLSGGWAEKVMKYLDIPKERTILLGQMANANGNQKIGERLWRNVE